MKTQVKYLEHVFHYFDEDCDGKISATELKNRISSMGGDQMLLEEAEDAVESLDSDGDGRLGLNDLARLMTEGQEEEDQRARELRVAFGMYVDVAESGGDESIITPVSLKRMLSRMGLGESRSVDECKKMINRFDLNGDGVINFEEFTVMMTMIA